MEFSNLPKTKKEAIAQFSVYYYTGLPCKWGHIDKRQTTNATCCECLRAKKEYHKEYRKRNKKELAAKKHQYYLNNIDAIKLKNAAYQNSNRKEKRIRDKKYYYENRTGLLQKSKKYRMKNKDKLAKIAAVYYLENRDVILEKGRQNNKIWYSKNKTKRSKYIKRWRKRNRGKTNAYTAHRRASIKNATPLWSEVTKINIIYEKCIELNKKWNTTFQVDHIIPILSPQVCGLHCWDNLQLLEASLNNKKNNKIS